MAKKRMNKHHGLKYGRALKLLGKNKGRVGEKINQVKNNDTFGPALQPAYTIIQGVYTIIEPTDHLKYIYRLH